MCDCNRVVVNAGGRPKSPKKFVGIRLSGESLRQLGKIAGKNRSQKIANAIAIASKIKV